MAFLALFVRHGRLRDLVSPFCCVTMMKSVEHRPSGIVVAVQ